MGLEMTHALDMLNKLLETRFDICIDYDVDEFYLREMRNHYQDKREKLLYEIGEPAILDEDYAKASIVVEAIRVYLREIAPTRRNKRRSRKRK